MIPLDVPLKDIQTFIRDKKGHVKIIIPNRKDLTIPLEPNEAKELIDKLNELIPIEKQKKAEHLLTAQKAEKELGRERARVRGH